MQRHVGQVHLGHVDGFDRKVRRRGRGDHLKAAHALDHQRFNVGEIKFHVAVNFELSGARRGGAGVIFRGGKLIAIKAQHIAGRTIIRPAVDGDRHLPCGWGTIEEIERPRTAALRSGCVFGEVAAKFQNGSALGVKEVVVGLGI